MTTSDFVHCVHSVAKNINAQILVLDEALRIEASECNAEDSSQLPEIHLDAAFYQNSDALMIYTSGTTGNPKGISSRLGILH